MKNIGKLLKDKRLELGMTIEDVSIKTRMTQKHIKAIEEGDINFFHDDLSYLRFFIKSYCEVLEVDFEEVKEELRESIDAYTETFTMATQRSHEKIENHIANSEKLSKVQSTDGKGAKTRTIKKPSLKLKKLKKTDFSLVSLVAVVGVVVGIIMCAFILFLRYDSGRTKPDSTNKQPVADVQKQNGNNKYPTTDEENEKNKEDEKKKEDTSKNISVTKNDVTHYTIDNAKEGDELNFEVYFGGSSSAFSVTVDGQVLADPASKAYDYLSTVKAKVVAKKDMRIQLYFGWLNATSMKLNGKNVKIDDSIVNSNTSAILEFTVTGVE